MALFKIFKGPESGLGDVPKHEGYAYFTTDKGNFYIDIKSDELNEDGTVKNAVGIRIQVNAKSASSLIDNTTGNLVEVSDLLLADTMLEVDQGGTGRDTLTVNAILLGNGADAVKMVSVTEGALVLGGNATTGLTELKGVGVLYALTEGSPVFGSKLPIELGGTDATTAEQARTNLDVYKKKDVDDAIEKATTLAWTTTLVSTGWIASGDRFTYSYANSDITCGKNGNVPPIITYTSNLDDYSKIDSAEATVGTGIIFTASKKPEADIGIIVTDNR